MMCKKNSVTRLSFIFETHHFGIMSRGNYKNVPSPTISFTNSDSIKKARIYCYS